MTFTGNAAHIIGGDMYYDYVSTDPLTGKITYKVYVALYRDCASNGADLDPYIYLVVYDATNKYLSNVKAPTPGKENLPLIFNSPCAATPTGICVERAIYSANVTLAPSVAGYTIAFTRCCRGGNVTNLDNPSSYGITLVTHIGGTNANATTNSSPRFANYPPLVICNNQNLNFDHHADDPDGDSLVYELTTPYNGASTNNPNPAPSGFGGMGSLPATLTLPTVAWDTPGGFSATTPMGPGSLTTINPKTGALFVDADLLGLFVIGIRVNEYRNGILISSSTRDFLFKVVNCVLTLQAKVTDQAAVPNFISFCQGLTVDFDNQSFGGSRYHWDFGVPGVDSDTSNVFTPSFTFPTPGVYDVTLYVNPGSACSDTAYSHFEVYEKLDINYVVPASQCIKNNSFDFTGTYNGPVGAAYKWDFGSHASPDSSVKLSTIGVAFDTSGYIPVTLSTTFKNCYEAKRDSIFIYSLPVIHFGDSSSSFCLPYTVHFYDSSQSSSILFYKWDFGDGTLGYVQNPDHDYLTMDTFDVTLTIRSTAGCIDTLTLIKPQFVKVPHSPISKFSVTPPTSDIYHATFHVSDESLYNVYNTYWFDDADSATNRNASFTYRDGGFHTIYQVVKNQLGCTDTSSQSIYITPESTVFIPNTFTPDGDDLNSYWLPVITDITEWDLFIYDRWGQVVFYSNDPKKGWDGTLDSKNAEQGTYVYKFAYTDIQTQARQEFTGHLNLLR